MKNLLLIFFLVTISLLVAAQPPPPQNYKGFGVAIVDSSGKLKREVISAGPFSTLVHIRRLTDTSFSGYLFVWQDSSLPNNEVAFCGKKFKAKYAVGTEYKLEITEHFEILSITDTMGLPIGQPNTGRDLTTGEYYWLGTFTTTTFPIEGIWSKGSDIMLGKATANKKTMWHKYYGSVGSDKYSGIDVLNTHSIVIGWMLEDLTTGLVQNLPAVSIPNIITMGQCKIYPNPAYENLTVEIGDNRKVAIGLYSTEGRQLKVFPTISAAKSNLDISDLPAGIYLLKLSDEYGRFFISKFVKGN